jgi:Cdc6-like AAA superfamily ATPase
MSKIILLIGRKKSGKTTKAKEVVQRLVLMGLPPIVYDTNNEYKDLELVEVENVKPNCRIITEDTQAAISAISKLSKVTFVMEDATIWLSGNIADLSLKRLIITCRHRQIASVFIFHSLNRVPNFLYEQSDLIYLFKTKENNATWAKFRDDDLKAAHFEVMNHESKHYYKTIRT